MLNVPDLFRLSSSRPADPITKLTSHINLSLFHSLDSVPANQITKLAIGVSGGAAGDVAKKFTYDNTVHCLQCRMLLASDSNQAYDCD